jgi:hypothetical protein
MQSYNNWNLISDCYKITQQKGGSNKVLHIVDLENLASPTKPEFCKKLIKTTGSSEGIKFIN